MEFRKYNFHKFKDFKIFKDFNVGHNYLNTCMPSMYPTSLHSLIGHQHKGSKPVVNATSVKLAPASWPQNTSHSWHNPHTLAPAHTVDKRGHGKVSAFVVSSLCQQSDSAGVYQAENLPSICR